MPFYGRISMYALYSSVLREGKASPNIMEIDVKWIVKCHGLNKLLEIYIVFFDTLANKIARVRDTNIHILKAFSQ